MKLPLIALEILITIQDPSISAKELNTLTCIVEKESNFKTNAINDKHNRNGTRDWGLFQINDIWVQECGHETPYELLDANNNISCALKIWEKQGLTAWSTFKRCKT